MMDEVLQNELDSLHSQTEVQMGGFFVANGVQHEIVNGQPAQLIRCKVIGGSFVGKLVGIAHEGKCLIGKLGVDDLRSFPTAPGRRHVLVDAWDTNDTYCAVSQSSIMSFGERSIRTSLRRDNCPICFFNGDRWKAVPPVPAATETETEAIRHPVVITDTVPPTAAEDYQTKTVARYRYKKGRTNYYVMFWNCGKDVFDQSIEGGSVKVVVCNREFVPKGGWFMVRFGQLRRTK